MKFLFILFSITFLVAPALAQPFVFHHATHEDELVNGAIEDNQGNYYIVGQVGEFNEDVYDGFIIKLNQSGGLIKKKRFFAENKFSTLNNIIQLDNGSLLAIGSTLPVGQSLAQLWLLNLDHDLNVIWEKKIYLGIGDFYAYKTKRDKDSALLVSGSFSTLSPYRFYIAFIKISQDGDLLAFFNFEDPAGLFAWASDVVEVKDLGQYWLFTSGLHNRGWVHTSEILKLDYSGNIIDTIFFTNPTYNSSQIGDERLYGVVTARALNDSTVIYVNRSSEVLSVFPSKDEKSLVVTVMDINDSIHHLKYFGKTDTLEFEAFTGLDFINPEEIFVAGTSVPEMPELLHFSIKYTSEFLLYQINSKGDVIWEGCYGNNTYLLLQHVLATSDGGCLLSGSSYDKNKATELERDIFIIKVDKDGNSALNVHSLEAEKTEVLVFPNPFSSILNFSITENLPATLEVYDFKGRQYLNRTITEENTTIQAFDWPQQLYFYRLTDAKGKVSTGKVSKVR